MVQEKEQIGIESLINKLFDRFEHIAEIHVAHIPSALEVTQLHITVHTSEAKSLNQSLYLTTANEATIDTGEVDPLPLPFNMIATVDGAGHMQGTEGTTVYMDDNVTGADPREIEAGLTMLRQKVAGICPSCGDDVESFGNHYRDSRTCQEAERV